MTKKLYHLTEEHKKQLKPWADKWIANTLNCNPMSEKDKEEMVKAIKGLYKSANLPPPKNIVFVPSPFILKFAGGFAAAIWYLKKNKTSDFITDTEGAIREATESAIREATEATYYATRDAIRAAIREAIREATEGGVRDATYYATEATEGAIREAIREAIEDAEDAYYATIDAIRATNDATNYNLNKWYYFNGDMKKLSYSLGLQEFGLNCAKCAFHMYQGGNFWSAYTSYISFFRHIAKLDIDYSKWEHWEKATIHGGPRIMHPDFCMVSDRPLYIKQDDKNNPHCIDGPFCEWRDGSKLFALWGVRVPGKYCLTPEDKIDIKEVLSEPNSEVRMAVLRKIGFDKALKQLPHKLIDSCKLSEDKKEDLIEIDLNDGLKVRGLYVTWKDKFSNKATFLPVPNIKSEFNVRWQELYGENWDGDMNNAEHVAYWTFGLPVGTPIYQHT